MNRVTASYVVFGAVMAALAPRALAQTRSVFVVASTNPCVDASSVALAIHRDTSLPVRVVTSDGAAERARDSADDTARPVVVEVRGQGEELTVELRGPDLQISQPL